VSDDKTEEPTDKKIEDARKKGNIAMSRDLARLCTLVVMMEIAFASESLWRQSIVGLIEFSLISIGKPFQHAMQDMFTSAAILLIVVFAVCYVACSVVAVAAHWGQFGVLIATESLAPSFDKLNPVNGLKNMVSKKKLMELLLSIGKAGLISFMVYTLVRNELPNIIHLSGGTPQDIYTGFVTFIKSVFHTIVVLCLIMGMIDFVIQKQQHKKSLMMDMEEIKREFKESEGDPMVKGQRKQLAREWAMEEPVAQTENANAVVVNPTHFAVAMFYDPDEAMVPVVLAKGKDEVAQAIIHRARQCGIPVIRHVWLARTLYASCKPGALIPKISYGPVAHVYAVVRELTMMNELDRSVELESNGVGPNDTQA
jgi:type III secretion protein U